MTTMADEQITPTTPTTLDRTNAEQSELSDIASMLGDLDETPAPRVDASGEGSSSGTPESKRSDEIKPEKKPKTDEEPQTAGQAWKQARAEKKAAAEERRRVEGERADLKAKERDLDVRLKDFDAFKAKAELLDRVLAGDADAIEEAQLDFEKLSRSYIESTTGDKKLSKVERELADLRKKLADDETKTREQASVADTARREAAGRRLIIDAASSHEVLKNFTGDDVVNMANVIGDLRTAQKLPLYDNVPDLFEAIVEQLRKEHAARSKALGATASEPASAARPTTISGADTKVRGPQTSKPFNRDDERAEIAAELAAAGFR